MRCQFCGWENPETKSTCEKCNQPLHPAINLGKSTVREDDASGKAAERRTQLKESFNPKATVRENNAGVEPASAICPSCGYSLEGEDVCPSCGTTVTAAEPEAPVHVGDFKKTIRPNHNHRFIQEEFKGFRLVKLSESGQPLSSVQFDNAEAVLNRENTDPSNQTITSQTQAIVKKEDEKWLISDESALHSTFVQASHPIELHNGDLILLGDQIFRFEAN